MYKRQDLILVVEGGRIVERGTHETLLAADGRYAELYRTQFATETDSHEAAGPDEDLVTGPDEDRSARADEDRDAGPELSGEPALVP